MFSMHWHVLLIFKFKKIKWTKIRVHIVNVVLFIYCFKKVYNWHWYGNKVDKQNGDRVIVKVHIGNQQL